MRSCNGGLWGHSQETDFALYTEITELNDLPSHGLVALHAQYTEAFSGAGGQKCVAGGAGSLSTTPPLDHRFQEGAHLEVNTIIYVHQPSLDFPLVTWLRLRQIGL